MNASLQPHKILACLAACVCMAGPIVHAQVDADADAKQRAERLATSPYRWILLAGKVKPKPAETDKAETEQDAPKAAAADRRMRTPAPVKKGSSRNSVPAPGEPVPSAPVAVNPVAKPVPVATQTPEPSSGEEIVFELFDAAGAKLLADKSVTDAGGGFFLPVAWTYSESVPNPVKASFFFDDKSRLINLSYDVPKSVGYFGGAGVTAYAPDDGKNLSVLVKDGRANGLLVVRLGTPVETRVKISVVGPSERSDSSYPFFILPLKPGIHTYGMELADFRPAPWAKAAPMMEETLAKVIAVSVEYAHGNANGLAPQGQIQVGDIRFSLRRE
jgi:hypothetical protein